VYVSDQKLNKTWLESRRLADRDRAVQERNNLKAAHIPSDGNMIRLLSRKGTYNTITFCDDELFDKTFPDAEAPEPRSKVRKKL
jgi:hypothetical protein